MPRCVPPGSIPRSVEQFHQRERGTAEATTLGAQMADFVVAAQAFHWFRRAETRREFERILRPGG